MFPCKQFYSCRCFYTNNIFLRNYKCHVNYFSEQQFFKDFSEVLKQKGCKDIQCLLPEILAEVQRRTEIPIKSIENTELIHKSYRPLHPHIFNFNNEFLSPSLLELQKLNSSPTTGNNDLLTRINTHNGEIYSFPFFSTIFCDLLVDELKNYEESNLPKNRPNSMNRYGISLDELGFHDFISHLRLNFLQPISKILFPEWTGDGLDSHKAFVVTYREGEDVDLSYHFDNAEVTLNISLNDSYSEGDLYFGPMRFVDSSFQNGYEHSKGTGLLHRGQQMHGAFPIDKGERYNLIIWMRSSSVRNILCPMCDDKPELEAVEGMGDGFTKPVHSLCLLN